MESPESPKRVQWSVRLPSDLVKQIEDLAEYEGKTIQEVSERVWRMFFEHTGPLPKKRTFLDKWPKGKPKKQ